MNKDENSIDWLIDRIKNQHLYAFMSLDELSTQAKKMHKEEHGKTWNVNKYSSFDEYYNKTFNK
jgi:hypothetical protein